VKRFFFLFFVIPFYLCANWDNFFSSDEDPAVVHHVNVMSGYLNLSIHDTTLQGAHPFSLGRSYSSSGLLERDQYGLETVRKNLRRDWLFQGGWNFLPHANLLVFSKDLSKGFSFKDVRFELPEPSGTVLSYTHTDKDTLRGDDRYYYYQPEKKNGSYSGTLSARHDPQNNKIRVRVNKRKPKDFEVTVFLADGGIREYRKLSKQFDNLNLYPFYYYKLVSERLPSGHFLDYQYNSKDVLSRIEVKNPARTKTHSWIRLDIDRFEPPFEFTATTSDNRSFLYKGVVPSHSCEYFGKVQSSSKRKEKFEYSKAGPRVGCHMNRIFLEDCCEVEVDYYDSPVHIRERDEKFYRKNIEVNKVKKLTSPVGENGEMKAIATFFYHPSYTDVIDSEGALSRYHHKDGRILEIEKFHKEGPRESVLKFIWKDERMIAKILLDKEGMPIFSKTFEYDEKGNVQEEILWGELTGTINKESFQLNSDGSLSGAESVHKSYRYDSHKNLLLYEKEEDGFSYFYGYKENTDLLTSKITKARNKIVKREFFVYDDDHLLKEEIVDNGVLFDKDDLTKVSRRTIRRYEHNANNGLILSLTELYLDIPSGSEHQIKKHVYSYDCHNLKEKEEVYDAKNRLRYTLYTEYDDRGHVTYQTSPLGKENFYKYDLKDHPIEVKEAGLPRTIYNRDAMGRVLSSEEFDEEGKSRTSYNTYDCKGRIVSQTNFEGNSTIQTYDTFGRCLTTDFPSAIDETGAEYIPQIHFEYDISGNLISTTNPKGETTRTEYNVFRNPTRIFKPDGTILTHTYYKNGTLVKTVDPDGTETHYTYDPFLRVESKKIYDSDDKLLAEEFWVYDTFDLLSHTDTNGLITRFSYDGIGRKTGEFAEERSVFYTYDSLGFLKTTTQGDVSKVTIHDVEGTVIQKWQQKGPSRENYTRLDYNKNSLLEKAYRITSKGYAVDSFSYDREGRLCKHEDPLGAETKFSYGYVQNKLGQSVLFKMTTDALGSKTIETHDALNKVVSREKQDIQGKTLSFEEFFYDRAGNKAKTIYTVYLQDTPTKKIVHSAEYDSAGRVIKELEADKKATYYSYDEVGRIKTRTSPRGITLTYSYDGLGRILSLKSSDGTIDYSYEYMRGMNPCEMTDLISGKKLLRSYNIFDELEEEQSELGTFSRKYDDMGRCISFTLPDGSSVTRDYTKGKLHRVVRRDPYNRPLYEHAYLQFDPNGKVKKEKLIYDLDVVCTDHDLLERPFLQTTRWNTYETSYDPPGRVYEINNSFFSKKTISYDALGQITQEGDKTYLFDSMGNSSIFETNDCNEIISSPEGTLKYDLDGNLTEKPLSNEVILYSYDALGRLTSVTHPGKKKISYSYDPASRLFSRDITSSGKTDKVFFLYDQDKEIGAVNEDGKVVELKVLGLGIGADIGAAVAVELDGTVYAPLQDFAGNCIALISKEGTVSELYKISAFGSEEASPSSPRNPWRFASKRQEDGLVFFGIRFYDLSLERWLTPDPSGFSDGPNLYLYVANNPLNRLDLFGLNSLDINQSPAIEVSINDIRQNIGSRASLIQAKALVEGVQIDYYVSCGHWYQMQFSPEELQPGKVNLLNHFAELLPKEGGQVGLFTFQNGIQTNISEFKEMCQSVIDQVPEGTLFLGMHNPPGSLKSDLERANDERNNIETSIVRKTCQMMGAIADTIQKINPDLVWLDLRHSEGGVIGRRAVERLTQDQQKIMQKQWMCLAFGPAKLIPQSYGIKVSNFYSEKDRVTKKYAKEQNDGFSYNVTFLPCTSTNNPWYGDHAFMGNTYTKERQDQFLKIREKRGFYDGNRR